MANCAQSMPESVGQAAYIGAGGAANSERDLGGGSKREKGNLVKGNSTGGDFYGFAAAGFAVQALAALLQCGVDGRQLRNLAPEGGECVFHVGAGQERDIGLGKGLTDGVVGIGCAAQRNFGVVGLVVALIIFDQPCGNTQAENKEPVSHRIQGAGMANTFLPTQSSDTLNDVVAGG